MPHAHPREVVCSQRRDRNADLIDEADVEHASAKDLIAQLEAASPEDELYDAKVKMLGEYIDHHVKEGWTPPRSAPGLAARKDELMAETS